MAAPTIYTEMDLAAYMKAILDEVALVIEWTEIIGKYQEPINETLLSYDVPTIDLALDIKKLRTVARREIWRAVAMATASNYRFGSDREQYFRNQIWEQAHSEFLSASIDASIYELNDARFNVGIVPLIDEQDPYVIPMTVGVEI